ncbi:unnamed protein product [Bursaphelenchus okinawaensis]|uniref:Uncharacterized protein n=1 Tax=Bursaphelenchus okinawaensis TaxID=465554 RepID=A0A811KCC5_9BILA|nr:unnamed protein product [Bursaphelenchus okinawaensis]CAG9099332.1 unnamed protein product [Bursaphelenchus okinawaensis]
MAPVGPKWLWKYQNNVILCRKLPGFDPIKKCIDLTDAGITKNGHEKVYLGKVIKTRNLAKPSNTKKIHDSANSDGKFLCHCCKIWRAKVGRKPGSKNASNQDWRSSKYTYPELKKNVPTRRSMPPVKDVDDESIGFRLKRVAANEGTIVKRKDRKRSKTENGDNTVLKTSQNVDYVAKRLQIKTSVPTFDENRNLTLPDQLISPSFTCDIISVNPIFEVTKSISENGDDNSIVDDQRNGITTEMYENQGIIAVEKGDNASVATRKSLVPYDLEDS